MSYGMKTLTGGRAIVEAARANGMRTIFGVPGAQIYPLFDALHGTGIELIVPRHEQAAAYMAMGYAKSTGRTGVFTVVPGPGCAERRGRVVHRDGQLRAARVPHGPSALVVPRQRPRPSTRARRSSRGTLRTLIKDAVRIDDAGRHVRDRQHARFATRPQRPAGPDRRRDVLGHDGGGGDGRHRTPATPNATSPSRRSRRHRRRRAAARRGQEADDHVRRGRAARRRGSPRARRALAGAR